MLTALYFICMLVLSDQFVQVDAETVLKDGLLEHEQVQYVRFVALREVAGLPERHGHPPQRFNHGGKHTGAVALGDEPGDGRNLGRRFHRHASCGLMPDISSSRSSSISTDRFAVMRSIPFARLALAQSTSMQHTP